MPNYLTRKDNTYYFRQTVPVELRRILGSLEIKKSLGRYAVTADNHSAMDYPRCRLIFHSRHLNWSCADHDHPRRK
jgi:hypothetical protein